MSYERKGRQRRKVLEEEEYISTLSSIVQRDYFPDLAELQKKAAVMDRRAAGDFAGAVAIRRAARNIANHEAALELQEEEEELNINSEHLRRTPRPVHRETLTGFHARVTSEDNHEFEQTQQREIKEHRQYLKEVFGEKPPLITDGREIVDRTPLLASNQFMDVHSQLEAPKNTSAGNSFFFTPDHSSKYETKEFNDSNNYILNEPTSLESNNDSILMPPPIGKGNSKTLSTIVPIRSLVEHIPKQNLEKRIEPSQTRFSPGVIIPQQTTRHSGDDYLSTTDYSTDAFTDLDSTPASLSVERIARSKRQRREHEAFVAMTPLIIPGRAGEPASPITTWGTINSTPMVLGMADSRSSPTPAFRMPEVNKKDNAARLAQTMLAKRNLNSKSASRHSTPLNTRSASLTSAAQALWTKKTPAGTTSVRSRSAFGTALRSSYTPEIRSSNREGLGSVTPRITSMAATTILSQHKPSTKDSKLNGNPTDGLLKI